MALATAPAATDRELLAETLDALRHSSREMVLLVLTSLRAMEEGVARPDAALGRDPSQHAYAAAVADNLSQVAGRRAQLVATSLSRAQVAHGLGVSTQAVSGMLERGALVGLKEGREWRIPGWQLDEESPSGVLPGLRELVDAFPGGVVALSRWIVREHPDLDGQTPRTALQRGGGDAVSRLARAL